MADGETSVPKFIGRSSGGDAEKVLAHSGAVTGSPATFNGRLGEDDFGVHPKSVTGLCGEGEIGGGKLFFGHVLLGLNVIGGQPAVVAFKGSHKRKMSVMSIQAHDRITYEHSGFYLTDGLKLLV